MDEKVHAKVDVVTLLRQLDIKTFEKNGVMWAKCPSPDHNDRTPSWRMISDPDHDKFGQHRCYGCGFGGWPVHLVEAVLGCSREEAREWLRDVSENPPVPFAVKVEFGVVRSRFAFPRGVHTLPLKEWPQAAYDYAVNTRGIAEWQIERWKVAFADGVYDKDKNPLAGRIVFPVHNGKGVLIGYTGRSYTGSKRRYKEPSKEEGADLGAVFGELHWPRPDLRRFVVVTEGAIDALAVERVFPYSMPIGGIYGSQLAPGHIARLSTFRNVLMATDPDKAGSRVASELEQQLKRWTNVVRVALPEGQDAASVDPQVLKTALTSAMREARIYDKTDHRDTLHTETRPTGCLKRTQTVHKGR